MSAQPKHEPTLEIQNEPLEGRAADTETLPSTGPAVLKESRETAEDLKRANEALRRANQGLEEFAYVASHDLREPLRMVNIYTQLLVQRFGSALDDEGRQFAQHVHNNVARMEELIEDVLSFSSTINPDRSCALCPTSLGRALERALLLYRDKLEAASASVEIGELPEVLGDENQLMLVFQNLLSNSLKYSHPDRRPSIRVWAQPQEGFWKVHFADNGIGFEPEFAERIFGLFKRLHGREVPGTGLGLAICRKIVERYGGEIWADKQRPAEGATFIFTLKAWNRYDTLANSTGGGQPG
jgi:light-regulated signal transduction histidine kinase (bacteriophytochrome)